jgi:hypothetical protein
LALLAVTLVVVKMIDRFMYKVLGKLDFLFDVAIPSIYERLKKLESFLKEKELKDKQQNLFTNLRKEVETGANGTQEYVIKKGINKDKIAKLNRRI